MTAKFTHNGFDFQFSDSDVVEVSDFIPAGESNPHNVRPWYFHEYGFCLGVTFADCESDALDILADAGRLDRYKVAESDMADYGEEAEGISFLGNASEPFDIQNLCMFALPHVPFSFAAMFMAAQAKEKAKQIIERVAAETDKPLYTVESGRQIFRGGAPFLSIVRTDQTQPVIPDTSVFTVCALLNNGADA